jgi:nucleoside-diphosphate-sugar epimerase
MAIDLLGSMKPLVFGAAGFVGVNVAVALGRRLFGSSP